MGFAVATYNINSIRKRLDLLKRWIAENGIDIVCLQETKVKDEEFPLDVFEGEGYRCIFRGFGGRAGIAVISRYDIADVEFGVAGLEEDRAVYFVVNDIKFLNIYAPQGRAPDHPEFVHKLNFYEKLIDFVASNIKNDEKFLLCGDFNIAPSDMDVHNPKRLKGHVCYREEVWDIFDRLISLGLVDLLRAFNPEKRVYTFYDYRVRDAVNRGIGWRVDHILATQPLYRRCVGCRVDIDLRIAENPSDHAPLVAVFD